MSGTAASSAAYFDAFVRSPLVISGRYLWNCANCSKILSGFNTYWTVEGPSVRSIRSSGYSVVPGVSTGCFHCRDRCFACLEFFSTRKRGKPVGNLDRRCFRSAGWGKDCPLFPYFPLGSLGQRTAAFESHRRSCGAVFICFLGNYMHDYPIWMYGLESVDCSRNHHESSCNPSPQKYPAHGIDQSASQKEFALPCILSPKRLLGRYKPF